jgi:Protein of unknown function (DUF3626)
MTPQEQQEILARLASNDVASLKDLEIVGNEFQKTLDETKALFKICKVLEVPFGEADTVCERLIQHLRESDLTINLRAQDFFNVMPGGSFINAFEKNHLGDGYMDKRDRAEEGLFGYTDADREMRMKKGLRDNVKDSLKKNMKEVMNRVKTFGSYSNGTNPAFAASIRPKYGALNYAGKKNGAADMYGNSYMVLKEHIKHNATYTDRESFNFASRSDAAAMAATFHHMDRLIINMDNDMLKKLYNAATGSNLTANVPRISYIEAQLHGVILFNRDVKKIYIANSEVPGQNVRDTITKFTRKNGILLEYI